MRKICVITGSRAEYGLLYWLMKLIKHDPALELQLVVTGSHLAKRFGQTYKQIIKDGFNINAKVPISLESDKDDKIAVATGEATKGMAKVFKRLKPDIVVVLGDRYEILAAVTAAVLMRIPVAHIHGGEVTEGAYDDAIRHAITKMSCLHFVSHEMYAMRVAQMGEDPKNIYNFGAPGLDSIKKLELLTKNELENILGFSLDSNTALVTFHPETLTKGQASFQVKELLKALKRSKLRLIFTMPGADAENHIIYKQISVFVKQNANRANLFSSLGQLRYLSLLKYVGLMIGNSSSGIIETPSFNLPVINLGKRQQGRIRAKNVIDVEINSGKIIKAIKNAQSAQFRLSMKPMVNPFGDGRASKKILGVLKRVNFRRLNKKFHDLPGLKPASDPIVLVGAGGHCQVVVEAIERAGRFKVVDTIDKYRNDKLPDLLSEGCKNAFVAVGSLGQPSLRQKLAKNLIKLGFKLPVIVHPSASVARTAEIGEGTFIGSQVVVGPNSKLGKHVIINSRAVVDHDCRLGDFVHIAPGAVLSGGVSVGNNSHIGTGASVIQYTEIGADTIIGSGSNVVKNIPANVKAFGNPCRVKGKNNA